MAIWTKDSGDLTTNNSYIKYRIRVILESQNVANNTSNVTVQVQVWRTNTGYTTRGTGTVNVNINGTNYSAGITSNQHFTYNSNTQIFTRNLNISHGSDGAKTLNTSASISHSQFSSSTQSFNTALNTIPRASTLSAFSFASHLKPSTAVNLSFTIDRKSTAFRHQIQLKDGAYVVQTWDNVDANGASIVQLSTANVNILLNRMSNVTSRPLTLRVATRSGVGGGWIGSAVTRNATATIDEDVKPTASALTVSQTGNNLTSDFLQAKSKITASFTRSGGYGATVIASDIVVRVNSNKTDSQTISSNDGTTNNPIRWNDTYEVIGTARDSRGRVNTVRTTFTSVRYVTPEITDFIAVRNSTTPTTVNITSKGSHTNLGGKNILGISLQKRIGTGEWTNVVANRNVTDGTFSLSDNSLSNQITTSYEFKLYIRDAFGGDTESIISVPTQRVVLDVHKNEGIGIGKIHEKGTLDVDGEAYFRGDLFVNGIPTSNAGALSQHSVTPSDTIDYYQSLPQGIYFILQGQLPNQPTPYGVMYHSRRDGDWNIIWYQQASGAVYRKSGNWNSMTDWIPIDRPATGSNENGNWIRFNDGTQICYAKRETSSAITVTMGAVFRTNTTTWTYPQAFVGARPMTQYQVTDKMGYAWAGLGSSASTITSSTFSAFAPAQVAVTVLVDCLVIGRWK